MLADSLFWSPIAESYVRTKYDMAKVFASRDEAKVISRWWSHLEYEHGNVSLSRSIVVGKKWCSRVLAI